MFEEWIGKQVKIFLQIGQDDIIRTGQILETGESHFKFQDKFGNVETFSNEAAQQIKGVDA